MNIPFLFALNTSTEAVGRLFDYTGSDGWENQTIKSLVAVPGSPDGLGVTAATRLAATGLKAYEALAATPAPFFVTGFSITAYWATSGVVPIVNFGVWDAVNSAFITLYPTLACTVSGGGIQKTFGKDEGGGIYVPFSSTLLPGFQVVNAAGVGGGTDGDVRLAGDVAVYVLRS